VGGADMRDRRITIRLEEPVRQGDAQVVAGEVAGVAAAPYRLWFRIPADVVVEPAAAAQAFVVSVVHQAMAVGRDVDVGGPVSRGLLANLDEYQRIWSMWLPRRFRRVVIRGTSTTDDEAPRLARGMILPFSGGLDSLFSAKTLAEGGELAALVTIQGLDVPLGDARRWAGVLASVQACARSLDRPLHEASTNWRELASELPGFLGYFLAAMATSMLLASRGGGVAMPSWLPYDRLQFPSETTPLTDPLLGRPGFPVRHHGAWARRIDKAAAVADWPEALRWMRPCDASRPDGTACGRCRKCIQTALTFCGLGLAVPSALGGVVPAVEDIERLEPTPYAIHGLAEAVAAAEARGLRAPWKDAAERLVAAFGGEPAAVVEIDHLRRRLRYLVGGRTRSGLGAAFRRISRAIRGRTGPPGLPELPQWPVAQPRDGTGVRPVTEATFARSARGRRIYVDGDDWRGPALVARGGDLDPTALVLWRALLASRRWTHVIDVGANYGEMLVDFDPPAGTRVVAVEPNPYVRRHLERSMREAGLPVEIVAAAVSDQVGPIELAVDRTWSGMTGVFADVPDGGGHRLERLEVEAITLAALLADATPPSASHVLVKLDVEGHELAVLRGLGGAASGYAAFAALVEVRHLTDADLALLLRTYDVDGFDVRSGAFVQPRSGSVGGIRALLATDGVHPRDVVLRPRTILG